MGHCENKQPPHRPLSGLNKYFPVVTGCVVFVQRGYSEMKTLLTSPTGVIYYVMSFKHGLTNLYGKGEGAVCDLSSKFAEGGVQCSMRLEVGS